MGKGHGGGAARPRRCVFAAVEARSCTAQRRGWTSGRCHDTPQCCHAAGAGPNAASLRAAASRRRGSAGPGGKSPDPHASRSQRSAREGGHERGGAVTVSISEDFARQAGPYRRELLAHCYRMLGSVHDAEDLVQETLLRAWRASGRFDSERASLRTWLYRIATNVCLTALAGRSRRPLPSAIAGPSEDIEQPLIRTEVPWLEPLPDAMVWAERADPAAVAVSRSSLRLAFVAALQLLPPRQRAILILREVLELPAAEVADMRATVDAYVTAFENADITTLTRLLTKDAVLEMPPVAAWYAGREDYGRFIARVWAMRGTDWRMMRVAANGQPAIAAYMGTGSGEYQLHSLQVL